MKLGGSGNSSGNGRRLEHHIGSTNYMTLLIALTVVGNVIHLMLCIMLSRGLMGTLAGETNANGDVIAKGTQGNEIDNEGEENDIMTSSQLWLQNPSLGIWNIVLVLTSAECARASSHAKTPFFVLSIPTRFYPLLLLFINGLSLSHVISAALGYALGKDKIEWIKLSYERRKWLEGDYGNGIGNGSSSMNNGSWGAGVLKRFTTLDGFVNGPSSAGIWIILGPNEGNSGEEGNDSTSSRGSVINATSSQRFGFMGQSQPQPQQNDQGGGWTPTVFRRPNSDGKSSMASSTNTTSSSQPGGGGHRLGTATRRSNASPLTGSTTGGNEQSKKVNREAVLAAAERRRNHDIEKGEK